MGDRNQLHSPMRRAKLAVLTWLDLLPKEIRDDAIMALDKLCDVAEKDIEQAYFDGSNQRRDAAAALKVREAAETGNAKVVLSNNNTTKGMNG